MNIQSIAVYLIFGGALFFIIYRGISAFRKKQCASGCAGGCNVTELSKIKIKSGE